MPILRTLAAPAIGLVAVLAVAYGVTQTSASRPVLVGTYNGTVSSIPAADVVLICRENYAQSFEVTSRRTGGQRWAIRAELASVGISTARVPACDATP